MFLRTKGSALALIGSLMLSASGCGGTDQSSADCNRAQEVVSEALQSGGELIRAIDAVDQEGSRAVSLGREIENELERARVAGDTQRGFELIPELAAVADDLDRLQAERDDLIQQASRELSRSSIAVEQNSECFSVDERIEAEALQRRIDELVR